jgi:thiol-disulfide isomerase/thioredoxin
MNQSLQIGPLALPLALLLGFAALALGGFAARRLARRSGTDVEPLLWRLLLVGAVAARLVFVVRFHDAYLKAPLGILDVRDGGWAPLAGFAVAALYAVIAGARRTTLRQPLVAALGTVAIVWAVGTLVLGALSASTDRRLPALQLQALDGPAVSLAGFHGKPTVVNLWASWCPPCRHEMPVLQQAQAARPDVNFVFVNQGESAGTVHGFLAAQQLALRNVLLDAHGEVATQMGSRALPTTLFFDAAGRLVDTRIGELSPATLGQRLAAVSPQPKTE